MNARLAFAIGFVILALSSHVQNALAQPTLPAYTLENFDKALSSTSIDSKGRKTIVIYGDELEFANLSIGTFRQQRQQDIVVIARSLRIGPDTQFEATGLSAQETLEELRGGDIYLVADTLTINGAKNGELRPALRINQSGGYNPSDVTAFQARAGRNYILVNQIVLDADYLRAKVQALNSGATAATQVPPAILKIIARGFSTANSIHKTVAQGLSVTWGGLGEAYQMWLAQEPVSALAPRELNLVQKRLNPYDGTNIPDFVGSMADAIKFLPAEIIAPWYTLYLERNATVAQAAIASKRYELAQSSVKNALKFSVDAPTQALASAKYKKAITDVQAVATALEQESVVQELSFPVDGAAPIRVTVIRDLAEGRVSIIPNQVLLSTVLDNDILRVGFMSQEGGDIRVNMRGRLTVDPATLEKIRQQFPKAETDIRISDDLRFDTLNLGLGDAIKDGRVEVLDGGNVNFNLLLKGQQYRPALLRLAQPFGIEASVNWRHQRLNLGNRTTTVNVGLGRTEMTILGRNGTLTNSSSQTVDIDYVLDGTRQIVVGFPIRLTAGKTFSPGCASPLCYAPGSAIRTVLSGTEVDTWLVSTPSASSVITYSFENQLDSDVARGGLFREMALDVTYISAPGAAPQRTGTFMLGRRGSATSKRSWSFIGPPAGGGKLIISGRAHWQNGFFDVIQRTVESTYTTIDESWIKSSSGQ